MNYVYYFVDFDENILYVGKTCNLRRRMKEHFTKGHLPKECYENVYKIYASKVNDSKCDTEICETLLINKYRPKFNKEKKFNEGIKRTNYNLLNLNFKEIYYDYETNTVSNVKLYSNCYSGKCFSDCAKCLISYNINVLKYKKHMLNVFLKDNNIDEKLFSDITKIYKLSELFLNEKLSNLDMLLSENDNIYDTFIAFDSACINFLEISNENLAKMFKMGFIFKVDKNNFGIPLLSDSLLKNTNYKE